MNKANSPSWLISAAVCALALVAAPTSAQITPDATLPNNSVVLPNGNVLTIEGGTVTGSNLFHSFQDFSIPTGNEAFFNNAISIDNIITRVTGGNLSDIDGLIRANGTANLFLINPNGIQFGPNASLNIGGSFLGSTADRLLFEDGSFYSATIEENGRDPLLSVNVPIGLQFGDNPGRIVNRSIAPSSLNLPVPDLPFPGIPDLTRSGLEVRPGRTLALVGGDIQLAGGNLSASNGQIYLSSIAREGSVNFSSTPSGWRFDRGNTDNGGQIALSDGSLLNTSGLGSGRVEMVGGNVTLDNARILALTLGNLDGRDIEIRAQQLQVGKGSQISTLTLGEGRGGNIQLQAADAIDLSGLGSESYQEILGSYAIFGLVNPFDPAIVLIGGTAGSGDAGDIAIETTDLRLRDGAIGLSTTLGTGNAGNLTARAQTIELVESALNNGTTRQSIGDGGNITLDTERLILRDKAGVASVTPSNGNAGNIAITATESVELFGSPPGAFIETFIGTNAFNLNGRAGDIGIQTQRLTLTEGAGITSSNGAILNGTLLSDAGGAGGDITIQASESIELSENSFIDAQTLNASPGGNIRISTVDLAMEGRSLISTASLNDGEAGDITIDANRVELRSSTDMTQRTSIAVSVGRINSASIDSLGGDNATGNGGELNLNVDRLVVRDGAIVSGEAFGSGSAGNLNLNAGEILLENQGSIDASTRSGLGGNINFQARDIQLREQSRIETNAGDATGGNIKIDTQTLTALENSDISANSTGARGGSIVIDAIAILGTEFRDVPTPESDITATSALGAEFSGVVQIQTPDVDPASGLVALDGGTLNSDTQVRNACAAAVGNRFVLAGSGGLPEDPTEFFRGRTVWRDTRLGEIQSHLTPNPTEAEPEESAAPTAPLVEATGWITNDRGQVELIVASGNPSYSPWQAHPECNTAIQTTPHPGSFEEK